MVYIDGPTTGPAQVEQQNLHRFIKITAIAVIVVCITVLVGWLLDIELLKRLVPSFTAMNPFTALGFIVAAVWLLLAVRWQHLPGGGMRWLPGLLAMFVFLSGVSRGIDTLFHTQYSWITRLTLDETKNQMSPPTAFGFAMLGLIMVVASVKRTSKGHFVLLVIPPCIMALISLFGYLIGENNILTLRPFKPMALHTTLSFLALSACFLALYPQNAFTRQIMSRDMGGITARRLLPFIIGVPFVLGLLRYHGERAGLYDTGFGVAILVVGAVIIFTWIIWKQAKELNQIDQQRQEIERKIEERSRELEVLNNSLSRSNEELEQFAFVASHDLQEPLRKISMFSDILRSRSTHLQEQDRKYIDKMARTSQRMSALISDLLHYSRLIHNKEAFARVSLKATVENIFHDFELVVQEKNVVVTVDELPTIEAIPFQINQLFYNLFSNALKFTDPGRQPRLHISCQQLGEKEKSQYPALNPQLLYYCFRISDNGIGFDMSNKDRVFRMFQRLHSKEAYTGSGIGLAVCKKVALNHQGDVLAESEEGVGTTFIVLLPQQQKP